MVQSNHDVCVFNVPMQVVSSVTDAHIQRQLGMHVVALMRLWSTRPYTDSTCRRYRIQPLAFCQVCRHQISPHPFNPQQMDVSPFLQNLPVQGPNSTSQGPDDSDPQDNQVSSSPEQTQSQIAHCGYDPQWIKPPIGSLPYFFWILVLEQQDHSPKHASVEANVFCLLTSSSTPCSTTCLMNNF